MFRAQHEGKLKRLARMYLKEEFYFSYKQISTLYLFSKLLLHLFKVSVDFVSTPLWVSFDAELWNTMFLTINSFYTLYTSGEVWSKRHQSQIQGEVYLPPRRGKTTYLTKERTPLFWMLPGSQNAFFSFFFTSSLVSRRSIFDSCSQNRTWYKWPH